MSGLQNYLVAAVTYGILCSLGCTADVQQELPQKAAVPVDSNDSFDDHEDSNRLYVEVDLDPESPNHGNIFLKGLGKNTVEAFKGDNPGSWDTYFQVYPYDTWKEDATVPPMLGSYSVESSFVRFTPRFPLVAGLAYRIYVDGEALFDENGRVPESRGTSIDTTFFVPRESSAPTHVAQIYPSTDMLPSNLLKLYIHFSDPMAEGHAYANLKLIDLATNLFVDAPFVEIEPELWSPDKKRFTLLFDPGRIKRLVGPNIELGPPLQAEHSYRLEVDRSWQDSHGEPLSHAYSKEFQVVDPDREKPRIEDWKIVAPAAATQEALVIRFPEPLDHALLYRVIRIFDPNEELLEGTIEIGRQEREWRFTPKGSWKAGEHEIHVDAFLEDLAGNTLRSLFDVDLRTSPPSEVREADSTKVISLYVLPADTPTPSL